MSLWHNELSYVSHQKYHQTSNIRLTLVSNKLVDHSDVIATSLVSAAPTTSLHSQLNTWLQWIGQRQLQNEMRDISTFGFGMTYTRGLKVLLCKVNLGKPIDHLENTRLPLLYQCVVVHKWSLHIKTKCHLSAHSGDNKRDQANPWASVGRPSFPAGHANG